MNKNSYFTTQKTTQMGKHKRHRLTHRKRHRASEKLVERDLQKAVQRSAPGSEVKAIIGMKDGHNTTETLKILEDMGVKLRLSTLVSVRFPKEKLKDLAKMTDRLDVIRGILSFSTC